MLERCVVRCAAHAGHDHQTHRGAPDPDGFEVAAGLHVHTPVVGTIAEGSVVFQIEGEPQPY
jgi:hypothetical protein